MMTTDCKNALGKIHQQHDDTKKEDVFTKASNWKRNNIHPIKGIEYDQKYEKDLEEINTIIKKCKLKWHTQGSQMIVNHKENVNIAYIFTEQFKQKPEIKTIINTGVYTGKFDYDQWLSGRMMIPLQRFISSFNIRYSQKVLQGFMQSKKSLPVLQKLFSINGPLYDTNEQINQLVDETIKQIK